MSVFTVTPEELGIAAEKLKVHSETYTEIYKQLLQQANTMGDAWQGEDNLKFVEQINGFCQELQQMSQKLMTASETLNKQKQNYLDRVESNKAVISKTAN